MKRSAISGRRQSGINATLFITTLVVIASFAGCRTSHPNELSKTLDSSTGSSPTLSNTADVEPEESFKLTDSAMFDGHVHETKSLCMGILGTKW